jgi:large subunit ribosomal protein L18
MDNSKVRRLKARRNRVMRVRKKVRGTDQRPRLSVSKTNKHIYAQIIDDVNGITIAGIGTLSKENQNTEHNGKSKKAARHIGNQIAELAKQKNIEAVVFDRGRYKFHGVVAELAQGARESGLRF